MGHQDLELKKMLHEIALIANEQSMFQCDAELHDANRAAIKLFGSRKPIFRQIEPDGPVKNITALSILRVKRYMKMRGIDLPTIDWGKVRQWLTENWDKILRVLLGLLPLVFMLF